MKIDQQQPNFMVINRTAESLYSLIADGKYRQTSLGRDTWQNLAGSNAALQPKCNKEGFNARSDQERMSKARIGILGNDQNNCRSCDSRIGFGTGGEYDDKNTCGNEASFMENSHDNRHKKALCYVLLQ